MMTNGENELEVHRCKQCGKPTPKKLGQCRHCNTPLNDQASTDWWSRTFDDGPTAKKGCFVFLAVSIAAVLFLIHSCSQSRLEAERVKKIATAELEAKDAKEKADNRRKGFHCLSSIDGSHPDLVDAVKRGLRDPDSYQHIETRITPVDTTGKHNLLMHYRARNGFGGMMDGVVTATVDPSTCKVHVLESE